MNQTMLKGITPTDTGSLWAGINNEQVKGDDPTASWYAYKNNPRNTGQVDNANMAKLLAALQAQQQANATTTANSISAFVSENKWLVLGGAGILAYFFLSGGLNASERTVTSVTRFSPRKSK